MLPCPPTTLGGLQLCGEEKQKKRCCPINRENNSQAWIESDRSETDFEYRYGNLKSGIKFEKNMNEIFVTEFIDCLSWHWSNILWSVKVMLEVLDDNYDKHVGIFMFVDGVLLFDKMQCC